MKKIIQGVLALAVLASIFVTNAKAQDAIAAWNEISEKAVNTAHHAPPVAALDFAIVHLAMYDAVESIDHRYEPYHAFVPGATGSLSAEAPPQSGPARRRDREAKKILARHTEMSEVWHPSTHMDAKRVNQDLEP